MIVSRMELAEIIGIPPAKVSSLQNGGVFKTVGHGKYDLGDSVRAFIEMSVEHLLKNKMPKAAEIPTENLQYWKMQRQKHAALKEMGVTMQIEQAERLMSARLGQIRNVLISIDSVWAPYMVGLKTVEESQRMLSKQLDTLFDQLSTLQDFEEEEEIVDSEAIEELTEDEPDDILDGEPEE